MSDQSYRKFAEIALRNAKEVWGEGWLQLTHDHRKALIAQQAVYILLGQDESMDDKYGAAKKLVQACMNGINL